MTVTWRALAAQAERELGAAGLPSPALDARRIVEEASGHAGAEYQLGLDQAAGEPGVAHFDQMLARRLAGEPLQYVLGRWGFRQLDLFVDRRVLIPRPETEVVVERALEELESQRSAGRSTPRVADLGTGSGAIGLSIALECPTAEVFATDASTDALEVARANLAGIGRAGVHVRLLSGSWFEALPAGLMGTFDLIVSNPPYIGRDEVLPPEVVDWEPADALFAGPTGTEALEQLVAESVDWLRPTGSLVVELAPTQADAVRRAALGAGFAQAEVVADLAGRERVVVARRPGRPRSVSS